MRDAEAVGDEGGEVIGGGGESECEGCFPIPELPTGCELVINILTTWGDRYYVGLTGIEVFTASGEKAQIAEVSSVCVCAVVYTS